MTFDDLSWLLVAMSLLGNFYVIKKNVIGQWLWAFGNLGWIFFDIYKEAYSQAFLFAIYLGMCVWGIIVWTREAREKEPAAKTAP